MRRIERLAPALMFQGTGSDVGKSLIVAGLCRAFSNRGLVVRPFKPQNMSNNAAVTQEHGEIGRAQALQARAARTPPSVHMNPVLLKPQGEVGAQIVVGGKVVGTARAAQFQAMKKALLPQVLESFARLRAEADIVLVEGAGSAAEINLRSNDIANMGFAQAADVPVILIGDIDRGGVIAQIVGTGVILDSSDHRLVAGFIVNKFRGDPSLFAPGMEFIARRTGWAPLGLIPHFDLADRLPAEDAFALDVRPRRTEAKQVIVAPRLAHIANFDDFDPLRMEPNIRFMFVSPGQTLPSDADLIILPGSKATLTDLADFRRNGWDIDLLAHVRRGGKVLGICGGLQMLGRSVSDPDGVEGPPDNACGLGLLNIDTVLGGPKSLKKVSGRSVADQIPFEGYEMHVGRTKGEDCGRPLLQFDNGGFDGAVSPDGRIRATYVHGLFSHDQQRSAWLSWLGAGQSEMRYDADVERTLDLLAEHLGKYLNLDRLFTIAR